MYTKKIKTKKNVTISINNKITEKTKTKKILISTQ